MNIYLWNTPQLIISINAFILDSHKHISSHQNDQTRRPNETPYEVVFCAQPTPVM